MSDATAHDARGMTDDEVLAALKDAQAILTGHFRLTSGRHSDTYVQCARILEDPALTTRLARAMVARMRPGRGSTWSRRRRSAASSSASRSPRHSASGSSSASARAARWSSAGGSTCRPGARVLVVEDVVTTGGSVAEVVDLVRAAGGEPVAVASIIDRGGPKAFDVPLVRLCFDSRWSLGTPTSAASLRLGNAALLAGKPVASGK